MRPDMLIYVRMRSNGIAVAHFCKFLENFDLFAEKYDSLPSNICQIQATLFGNTPPSPIDSRTVRPKTRWRKGWRRPFWAVFAPFCTVFAPFRTIFALLCAVSDRSESFSDRFERRTLRKLASNSQNFRENSRIACFARNLKFSEVCYLHWNASVCIPTYRNVTSGPNS